MKKLLPVVIAALLAALGIQLYDGPGSGQPLPADNADDVIGEAFSERRNNLQVAGSGMVTRLLADDNDGSRHQRFIVELRSGQTVLIAHNIDVAPRIDSLRTGDQIGFFGEYEWNDRGGVIHWTHHDPAGRHVDGWLEHNGQRYE